MVYSELKRLKDKLEKKTNRTEEENKLLSELETLGPVIEKSISKFSLSTANNVCPTCGRPLK